MSDSIAAISTPQNIGGIGIIRVSGEDAIEIADRCFKAFNKKKLKELNGYTAAYGKIYYENEPVDECVALVFKAPKSYTGENVVEISCHGGLYVMQKALRAVFLAGAKPAQPGEFTKRAFLNGKLDLSEAEGVMGIISAYGEQGAKVALTALDGALSRKIQQLCHVLVSQAAHMSAWVDYPDDEIEEIDLSSMKKDFSFVADELQSLLSKFDAGQAITQGIETAIIGKPNVGKSALMNMLSGFKRSIVTDVAGTTRDVVEQTIRLGSVVLHLADTAGIHSTEDMVECIGVDMAKSRIERASLILAVFDGSQPLTDSDREILTLSKGKTAVAIVNKSDLPQKTDFDFIHSVIPNVISVSALNGEGEKEIAQTIEKLLGTDEIDTSCAMLATERQRRNADEAYKAVREAVEAIEMGMTMDAVNVCVDNAISSMLELTGQKASDAVIDEVFSQFCVGK